MARYFLSQVEKPVKSKPYYNCRSVSQSLRLDIEPVVEFNTCLTAVRVCPLSAVTISVGSVCTHTYVLCLRYLQCLVVFTIRSTYAVYSAPVTADNDLS